VVPGVAGPNPFDPAGPKLCVVSKLSGASKVCVVSKRPLLA
jgi:hypothetical protein